VCTTWICTAILHYFVTLLSLLIRKSINLLKIKCIRETVGDEFGFDNWHMFRKQIVMCSDSIVNKQNEINLKK